MAIASLTLWLNDPKRDYNHGRLLYEQYGSNPVILTILRSGSGSYHFSKLQTAIEQLNQKTDLVPKPIVIAEFVKEPAPKPGNKIKDFKSAPDQIIDIEREKSQRYAQARKLHETIRIMDDKDHRLAAALELLDHMDFVRTCWDSIDLYNETGEVKPLPQEQEATPVDRLSVPELLKEQKNLPPNISKDKKKAAAASTAALKLKFSMRMEWRIERLQQINERLASL